MKFLLPLLFLINTTYAKTSKPKVDLVIHTLQKELFPAQKNKEYLDEILKLKKKTPNYLPLEIEYIFALNINHFDEVAQDIYKTRFEKKKTKTNEFLYLFSQVV